MAIPLALAALVGTSPALAVRRAVMPARAGYPPSLGGTPFSQQLGCYGIASGDYEGNVRRINTNCTASSYWVMPIPVENRVGGGILNAWASVDLGTNVTSDLTLSTYYSNGTYFTQSPKAVSTSGRYQLTPTAVPENGSAAIWVYMSSYYMRVNNYEYEYEY